MWLLVFLSWIIGHALIHPFSFLSIPLSLVISVCFVCVLVLFSKIKWLKVICYSITFLMLGHQHAQIHLVQTLQTREVKKEQTKVLARIEHVSEPNNIQLIHVFEPKDTLWRATIDPKKHLVEIGKIYELEGVVHPTQSYAVPFVFDKEKWFLQQGIMASFKVKHVEPKSTSSLLSRFQKFKIFIEQKRLHTREAIQQRHFLHQGLMLALLTGDEYLLDTKTQELFQNLGISHLLAISGPHVLIFAMLMSLLLHFFIAYFFPKTYLYFPKPYVLAVPFLGCVFLYCAFTGFEIPALRTFTTVSILTLALFLHKKLSACFIVVFSASILLYFEPLSIFSVAFWLSYGACLVLIQVYQTISLDQAVTWQQKVGFVIYQFIQSQFKVFLTLLPLTLFFFHYTSWTSSLANLIAIPLLGGFIVPLEVCASCIGVFLPSVDTWLFGIADFSLDILLGFLIRLDGLTRPTLIALTPLKILLMSLGLLILFLPKGIIPKSWGLICLGTLFLPVQKNEIEVNVLDVGQGQAIFVRDDEQSLLIDTGGAFDESKFSIAKRVLIPYLASNGIKALNHVVLSHLDTDHSGAYPILEKEIKVKNLMSSEYNSDFKAPFQYCQKGQEIQYKHITVQILYPEKPQKIEDPKQRNDQSCIVYLQHPNFNMLIMGDAGQQPEQEIMRLYPHLKVDILVLGHHGSKHSSSLDFLKHYHPKIAVASVGRDNVYGHPSQEVQMRLKTLGISLWTTRDQGTIQFKQKDGQLQTSFYRDSRLWLKHD